jgi:hypothetical protein
MNVLVSAFFREWGARLDSRRPTVIRGTNNHSAPPILVESGGDLDFPIRLVSGASRLGALGHAATIPARRCWRAGRVTPCADRFRRLVLIGLWLTFVGWTATTNRPVDKGAGE